MTDSEQAVRLAREHGPPETSEDVFLYGTSVKVYCDRCKSPKKVKAGARRTVGVTLYVGDAELAEEVAIEHLQKCPRRMVWMQRCLYVVAK